MPKYEIGLKRVEYGYTIINAKNEKEARSKAFMREGKEHFYPEQDFLLAPDITEVLQEDEY